MHLVSIVIWLRSMLLLPLILTALTAATSSRAGVCLPETRVRDFFSSTPEIHLAKQGLTHRKHRGKQRFNAGLASGRSSFHKDHLGSTTVVTDTFGTPDQDLTQYRPYGLQRAGSSLSGKTDYGFTDQEFDKTTGFYNYDARLYNPEIGMFNTPDTLLQDMYDPQMLNRYAYTRNNPIKYVDPDGSSYKDFLSLKSSKAFFARMLYKTAQAIKATPAAMAKKAAENADAAQRGLDAAGFAPEPYGTGADIANTGVSAARGNYTDALGYFAGAVAVGVAGVIVKEGLQALPKLDKTGKVHGNLPDVKNLGNYQPEDLVDLRDELKKSVQKRIEVTVQKGSDKKHGERQAAEQRKR